jgi:hypothetical protein
LINAVPGLKPWAVLSDHFMVNNDVPGDVGDHGDVGVENELLDPSGIIGSAKSRDTVCAGYSG